MSLVPAVCGGPLGGSGPTTPAVAPAGGGPPPRGRRGAKSPMLPVAPSFPWAVVRMSGDESHPNAAVLADATDSSRTRLTAAARLGRGVDPPSAAGGGTPPRRQRRRRSSLPPPAVADSGDDASTRATDPIPAAVVAADVSPPAVRCTNRQSTAGNAARSAATRARWADPAYRQRMAERPPRGLGRAPTRPRRDPNAPRRPVGRPRGAVGAAKAAAAAAADAAAASGGNPTAASGAPPDPPAVAPRSPEARRAAHGAHMKSLWKMWAERAAPKSALMLAAARPRARRSVASIRERREKRATAVLAGYRLEPDLRVV